MTDSVADVDTKDGGPSAPIKILVLATLAMLLVAGTRPIEAWPFTGWRLYSNTTGPISGALIPYRVDGSGDEHVIDFDRLPYAYPRAPYVLKKKKVDRLSDQEREELCEALAEGEREGGRTVTEIRLYLEVIRVVPKDGEKTTKLLNRELSYTCARSEP